MVIITGFLDFPDLDPTEVRAALDEVTVLSRQDDGCIDYWWAEDARRPMRFRFFECWESQDHLDRHRDQPFEHEFLARWASRCSGADAYTYAVADRRRES